jgi:hypothetical protein
MGTNGERAHGGAPPHVTPTRSAETEARRAAWSRPLVVASSRHGGPCQRTIQGGPSASPPSHAGWSGQETGQGMEQGQLGRRHPGDEPRATRRFQRDAVVFEDYAIHEGMVIPQGAIRARYDPETCPELPPQLARLSRGDTAAALAFVRTYGLLGYAQLAAAVGRREHSLAPGDPLAWIWAQAATVALCLLLTYGLQAGDDATLQHGLRALQLPQPPQPDGGPLLIVPAVWDQPRVHICWPSPLHSPEDWQTYARAIRREVINAHLLGIRPQLVERGATEHPGCQFQALIAMVYWHLLQVAARGVVQRCAEASCRAFFVQTRRTQRFCPAEKPARDSRCAVRARRRAGR